ncbi:MAG: hypothetical protein ACR2OJ_01380 [Hyphomicrobiales bacterium]
MWKLVDLAVDELFKNASKIGVKVTFETDIFMDAKNTKNQGDLLARLGKWYLPYEVMKIATSEKSELLALTAYQQGCSRNAS